MYIEKLNPFWKALTVTLGAIILSFSYTVFLNLAVFAFSLTMVLLCSYTRKIKVLKLLLPVVVLAVSLLLTGVFFSKGDSSGVTGSIGVAAIKIGSLYNGLQLATRVLAFAGLGLMFSLTTDAQEFINSLIHQAHLPVKFAYGTLAAVHLLPNIKKEYMDARSALCARGAKVNAFSIKPLFLMLVHSIQWSETLAIAMESKGFCPESPRTSYHIPKVRWYDIAFFLSSMLLLVFGYFMNV